MADAEDIYEYSSSAENTYFVYPRHRKLDDTKFAIANYFMAKPLGKYGIELKDEKKLIGTIDLRLQATRMSGEIGYILNEKYQGQGYGREAAQTILSFAFTILELHKVTANCQSQNRPSESLMQAIGMKKEGCLRAHEIWKNGEWVDLLQYGILRKEYFEQERVRVSKR